MIDFEVHCDAEHVSIDRIEEIRCSSAEIDDRMHRREPAQHAAIRHDAAEIAIEASQIAQRALHIEPRSVVIVEKLLFVDARRREHA